MKSPEAVLPIAPFNMTLRIGDPFKPLGLRDTPCRLLGAEGSTSADSDAGSIMAHLPLASETFPAYTGEPTN